VNEIALNEPNKFYKSMDVVELSYVDKNGEGGLKSKFFYSEFAAMKYVENIEHAQGATWYIIETVDIFKEN